jgi:hypothetical protein
LACGAAKVRNPPFVSIDVNGPELPFDPRS